MRTTPLDSDQQRIVAELTIHPAWVVLSGIVKEKMEQDYMLLARELMRGEYPDNMEYRRGFFEGMKFLLRQPDLEAHALNKALRKQGV